MFGDELYKQSIAGYTDRILWIDNKITVQIFLHRDLRSSDTRMT